MSYKQNDALILDVISAKLNRPSKPLKRVYGIGNTIQPTDKLTQDEWFNFLYSRKSKLNLELTK